jgi:multiple sugar transport system ATP-binding protein
VTGDVQLQGVSKVYPSARTADQAAVRDVSLTIAPGELLVLVGPSGCGKSTLLRMIAGLETISSGTIRIAGNVVNDTPPKDRDVAMVFQNYALYPHMTVEENMGFALRMRGMPKAQRAEKVRAAAQSLGLTDLLSRKPGELSGGQRQRVALGRAIVREPQVFLFDEPLSNLDARLRVSTRGEIKALHQRLRVTTVYVTHDQEEAMTLGDRIAVMHAGQVRQCDTPLAVYAKPADRMVAGFVGTPSMNFVDGVIDRVGGAWHVRAGNWLVPIGHGTCNDASLADGKPVALGVRPTGLTLTGADAASHPDALPGTIHVVEPLGEATDLHVQTPLGLLVARVPLSAPAFRAGDAVRVRATPASMHLFEQGELGKRL